MRFAPHFVVVATAACLAVACGGKAPIEGVGAAGAGGVAMGATEQFVASGRTFRARNLRSFQTEWCDDYWNWAYWVVEQ